MPSGSNSLSLKQTTARQIMTARRQQVLTHSDPKSKEVRENKRHAREHMSTIIT